MNVELILNLIFGVIYLAFIIPFILTTLTHGDEAERKGCIEIIVAFGIFCVILIATMWFISH